tara:strand:+ start:51 stop:305 length:255 start_codon:yes stop_codon:yes gene_type:complete
MPKEIKLFQELKVDNLKNYYLLSSSLLKFEMKKKWILTRTNHDIEVLLVQYKEIIKKKIKTYIQLFFLIEDIKKIHLNNRIKLV